MAKVQVDGREALTTAQVAKLLGVSQGRIRQFVMLRELRVAAVVSRNLFFRDEALGLRERIHGKAR